MIQADLGNVILKEDHIVYGDNGRVKGRVNYEDIKEVTLSYEHRSRWIVEFALGLLIFAVPTFFILKFGVLILLSEYDLNISTAFAVLSGYSLFFMLGLNGLKAVKKRYFLSLNPNVKVELKGKTFTEVWNHFTEILDEKGLGKIEITVNPNCPLSVLSALQKSGQ